MKRTTTQITPNAMMRVFMSQGVRGKKQGKWMGRSDNKQVLVKEQRRGRRSIPIVMMSITVGAATIDAIIGFSLLIVLGSGGGHEKADQHHNNEHSS